MSVQGEPAAGDDTPASAPVAGTRKSSSILSKAIAVVLAFVPAPIQRIWQQGLWRFLCWSLAAVFVLPLLLLWSAAFWLKQSTDLDWRFVRAMREAYLDYVYEGLALEGVVARSYDRLDYLQAFAFDLKGGREAKKSVPIVIRSRQRTILELNQVTLHQLPVDERGREATKAGSENPCTNATLPSDDLHLVEIYLGDALLTTLGEGRNMTHTYNFEKWWDTVPANVKESPRQLVFRLSDSAKSVKCAFVHVEGSISVYKDLLPVQVPPVKVPPVKVRQ